MGFGYLLIGYLVTFVLHLTVAQLGFGGLTLLLGYGLMLQGLRLLTRYQKAFSYAKWLLCPLLVTAAYDLINSFDEMLSWGLPVCGARVDNVFSWVSFLLLILFNLAMLYGIRIISQELGILHMATAGARNSIFVGIYALLYIIAHLPITVIENAQNYLALPLVLTNIIWVFCNLVLLLSCNKNICPAGDEEQPVRPTRFKLIDRLNEAYEKNRQSAVDRSRQDVEDALRRRREKMEQKNKRTKNKKSKK